MKDYPECESCAWRDHEIDLCSMCEDADQYEIAPEFKKADEHDLALLNIAIREAA